MPKTRYRGLATPQIGRISKQIIKIQQSLLFDQALTSPQSCLCQLCQSKKNCQKQKKIHPSEKNKEQNGEKYFLEIMNGLCGKGTPTLKLFIPELCFVGDDSLQIFYVDPKDCRIKKIEGIIPVKALLSSMLGLRRKYNQILEQNFHKIFPSQINPEFVHQKYLENVLPSYFDDSESSRLLQQNRFRCMNYVLHKDKNMLIQSIEGYKLNENEPFCMVRFRDGNAQIFSKKQFEIYCLSNSISQNICYVQSFIKEKKEKQLDASNFTSCYSLNYETDKQLFEKAEKQILILIGGIQKYNSQYEDIEVLEDMSAEMMRTNTNKYVLYMTYKIVHYLAMVARIFVKHIKINWVLSDFGMAYIQSIFEFESTDLPERRIKYEFLPMQEKVTLYKDSQNFINLYKQVQMMRQVKRNKIVSQLLKEEERNNFSSCDHILANKPLAIAQRLSKSIINGSNAIKRENKGKKVLTIQRKCMKQKISTQSLNKGNKKFWQIKKNTKFAS